MLELSHAMVEQAIANHKNLQETLKELFSNKELPLEERWNLFLKAEPLLDDGGYEGRRTIGILTDSPYDDLGLERYECQTFATLDEQLQENYPPEGEEDDEYYERYKFMWTKRDEWREAVLNSGYGSFTNDW